jgi:protein involved in polysaccharide export with SLBB domain
MIGIIIPFSVLFLLTSLFGQEKDFSQIVVHIWGEVGQPGEYRVSDGTDILGIISKAGGPTQFSRLSKVRLTRTLQDVLALHQMPHLSSNGDASSDKSGTHNLQLKSHQRVVEIDVSRYLKQHQKVQPLPMLQSGDIVFIPRNRWSTWRTVASIIRDVAIVANAYYWFQIAK